MEVVLQHVSMMPGVMGCFMCNSAGRPLARSFPATCDAAVLKRTSAILPEIAETLHGQTDGAKLVDLNYDVGRIIVKQLPEGFQKYSLSINENDIHHVLYFADLFIGDSQSMTVEAAMLGTPSIRINNFANKISIIKVMTGMVSRNNA